MYKILIKKGSGYVPIECGEIPIEFQIYKKDDIFTNYSTFSYSFDLYKTVKNLDILGIKEANLIDTKKEYECIFTNQKYSMPCILTINSISKDSYKCILKSNIQALLDELKNTLISTIKSNPFGNVRIPYSLSELDKSYDKTESVIFPNVGYMCNRNQSSVRYSNPETGQLTNAFPLIKLRDCLREIFSLFGYTINLNNNDYDFYIACKRLSLTNMIITSGYESWSKKDWTNSSAALNNLHFVFQNISGGNKLRFVSGCNTSTSSNTIDLKSVRVVGNKFETNSTGILVEYKSIIRGGKEFFELKNEMKESGIESHPYLLFAFTNTDAFAQRQYLCAPFNRNYNTLTRSNVNSFSDVTSVGVNFSPVSDTTTYDYFMAPYNRYLKNPDFSKWEESDDGTHYIHILYKLDGTVYRYYDKSNIITPIVTEGNLGLPSKLESFAVIPNIESYLDAGQVSAWLILIKTIDDDNTGGKSINIGESLGYDTLFDLIDAYCKITNSFFTFQDFKTINFYSKNITDSIDIQYEIQSTEFIESSELGVKEIENTEVKKLITGDDYIDWKIGESESAINITHIADKNMVVPYKKYIKTDETTKIDEFESIDLVAPTLVRVFWKGSAGNYSPEISQSQYNNTTSGNYDFFKTFNDANKLYNSNIKIELTVPTTDNIVNKKIYIKEYRLWAIILSQKTQKNTSKLECYVIN